MNEPSEIALSVAHGVLAGIDNLVAAGLSREVVIEGIRLVLAQLEFDAGQIVN
ncbi:hypothetical protein [Staphylococcus aureus]